MIHIELIHIYKSGILIYIKRVMKTSIILKDDILNAAIEATGITEKTALIHLGLQELIRKSAYESLIKLGGSDPKASTAKRDRQKSKK